MTLLVIGITVPVLSDAGSVDEMADALNDQSESFVSFFISFAVIGRYWFAHHQFYSAVKAFDAGLVAINLFYLAFIAFLPFPTALLGAYFDNPLSVVIYATCVGIISGLEVVMYRHAHRGGLMRRSLPEDVYRWSASMALAPLVFFVISIPVAFLSTTVAVILWFGAIPFDRVIERYKPKNADRYLRGSR